MLRRSTPSRPGRARLGLWLLAGLVAVPALALIDTEDLDVFLFLGHFESDPAGVVPGPAVASPDVPTACPGVDPDHWDAGAHDSALAPDGSLYIADWSHDVILHLTEACGLVRVAGDAGASGQTALPAVATDVSLDGPWGIDVAADGTVYFAEYQISIDCGGLLCTGTSAPHTAGRILKLADGTLSEVAAVPSPSQVKVGRGGLLYASSMNGHGDAGVWEVTLSTGSTRKLGDVDSEGLALFESVATDERKLYAAAQIPGGQTWSDVFVCEIDPRDPAATCSGTSAILRPDVAYGAPVGPQLETLLVDGVDIYPGRNRITELAVDSAGFLYLVYGNFVNGHIFGCETQSGIKKSFHKGVGFPRVYRWLPGGPDATRIFGKAAITGAEVPIANFTCTSFAPYAPGTPSSSLAAVRPHGSSLSIGRGDGLLVGERCAWSATPDGQAECTEIPAEGRSYEIQDAVTGDPLFLGADLASFTVKDWLGNTVYAIEDAVIDGTASFAYDAGTQTVTSIQIVGAFEGQLGAGWAWIVLSPGGGLPGFFSGDLWISDGSFVHTSAIAAALGAPASASGNTVQVDLVATDLFDPTRGTVELELMDGL